MSSNYAIETVLQSIPEVSCVEADQTNLIVGTSDGQILHYVINREDPESDLLDFTYLLASRQDAPGRKGPKRILLLECVQLAAVLANDTLSFYSLPEFAPASHLRILKDVQGVIQSSTLQDKVEVDGCAMLTLFTKKKVRQIKVSRQVVKLFKEVEYAGCETACQIGAIVCLATRSSYDMIDLDQRAKIPLFPVVQGESNPVGEQYASFLPHIVSAMPKEFLVASGSPESPTTMGLFITLEGEITRGTLMFAAYPIKILVDGKYTIALLSNRTIEIHEMSTQAVLQIIDAPDVTDLTWTSAPVPVVSCRHIDMIILQANRPLFEQLKTLEKPALLDLNRARSISDVLSQILLVRKTGIGALITETRLIVIDHLLDTGELQAALDEAEQLARDTPPAFAERLYHELAYIHQKAGLLYFDRMLFDDAVDHFKKGNIDPRIIIAKFPEFEQLDTKASLYSGLRGTVDRSSNVDEIILRNLSETVDDNETLVELSVIVKSNALELLRRYLTDFRERKEFASSGHGQDSSSLFSVVDSTLLEILLQMDPGESKSRLETFLGTSMESPDEIISILKKHKSYHYLSQLYAKLSRHKECLDIVRKSITGEIVDGQAKSDGIVQMRDYLLSFGDSDLIWEFGLFLIRTAPETGLQLLCHAVDAALVSFTIQDVLNSLRENEEDFSIFMLLLEHLIVVIHLDNVALYDELIQIYAKRMIEILSSQVTARQFLKQSNDEYRSLPAPKVPYLTFVSQFSTQEDEIVVGQFLLLRNKLINVLQGNISYDADAVLNIILQRRDMLLAEQILLFGRLSKHSESLNLMVHDLKDFDSAEVYCYHGGISLSQIRITNDKRETVVMRRKLFPLLFEECLKLEDYSLQFAQASEVLNRWGNYMDVAIILELVPEHWSIEMISQFLISALSQLAGEKRDAQIQRSLARGQLKHQSAQSYVLLN
ncbi:Putative uncharacterized protein [Taphrina deformans PYCC 5710]|uniref:CNH domain-containing protein n=1 Tax=Taphrina deformans (strain PYCC 5710 / ATCC 11124 / CBS 356.35 / IMI 108563 / JCM 9778 / NBRC 8474) TaxID=1097556 RepID=R4XAS1_TAPDE|nr:Putative uncharacterized protein [Taphrina deformans PYCC 5710]|eukprot:CCG82954.1 Putative uncharacterized protein [Taphrina deformans PYCC 5710]